MSKAFDSSQRRLSGDQRVDAATAARMPSWQLRSDREETGTLVREFRRFWHAGARLTALSATQHTSNALLDAGH